MNVLFAIGARGRFACGDFFDKGHDGTAHDRFADLSVGAQQAEGPGDDQVFEIEPRGFRADDLVGTAGPAEKRSDRHAQYLGNLGEAAGANPIRAFFVFLNLLKCHADLFAELGLRYASCHALDANSTSHFDVDGIGTFLRHFGLRQPLAVHDTRARGSTTPFADCQLDGRYGILDTCTF